MISTDKSRTFVYACKLGSRFMAKKNLLRMSDKTYNDLKRDLDSIQTEIQPSEVYAGGIFLGLISFILILVNHPLWASP